MDKVSSSRYPIDEYGERILTSALTEFAHAGFAGARMSDIARRAGLSVSTLALYFTSKEELFREVVRSAVAATVDDNPERCAAPNPTTAVDRLRQFATRFWRVMQRPEQEHLLRLSISELSGFPELALLYSSVIVNRSIGQLERILSDGVRRKELRALESRSVARIIFSTMVVHALWFSRAGVHAGVTAPNRHDAEAALLDAIGELLSRGPVAG